MCKVPSPYGSSDAFGTADGARGEACRGARQVLSGLKVVKANGWEPRFQERLVRLQGTESRLELRRKRLPSKAGRNSDSV